MRSLTLSMAMLAMLKVCGAEPVPVAPTFALTAQHGGSVLRADDHWIELVTKSDGSVDAYVVDAAGAPPPTAATVVTARIPGEDRRPHDVALVWSPEQGRFQGRLEDVRPAAGPVEVVVIVSGRPRRASAPSVVVVSVPDPVIVDARPRRERGRDRTVVIDDRRRGPDVVLVAPDPRPSVVVYAPDPRPGIVVVGPRAPSPQVVIVDGHPGRGRGHWGHPGRGHGGGRGRGHGGRGRGHDD